MAKSMNEQRLQTRKRIRGRVSGTADKPRLTVYKSLQRIYVQAIDDAQGVTLATASTLEKDLRAKVKSGSNIEAAKIVGQQIAARLKEKGITTVVFDRNGYVYHGRVKALWIRLVKPVLSSRGIYGKRIQRKTIGTHSSPPISKTTAIKIKWSTLAASPRSLRAVKTSPFQRWLSWVMEKVK